MGKEGRKRKLEVDFSCEGQRYDDVYCIIDNKLIKILIFIKYTYILLK